MPSVLLMKVLIMKKSHLIPQAYVIEVSDFFNIKKPY